jgi:hypothetical protein
MPELPQDSKIPDLLSVPEAAAELGMTRQGVRKAAARGQILGKKVGEVWVFRPAVIQQAKRARGKE